MQGLHTSILQRCLERIEDGLAQHRADAASDLKRDGLIQRFEYSFEMAVSTLRRALDIKLGVTGTAKLGLPDITRTAYEYGLLQSSWDTWAGYRDARNRTSHTYSEKAAEAVVERIPDFVAELQFLQGKLSAL